MKILVFGGNRYFGKKLVSLLLDRGDEVTVLNRGSREDDFGTRVTRVKCDRNDARELARQVGGESWDVIYDQICYDAGRAGEACKIFAGKTGRYIFTSSQSVYEYGSDLTEEAFDPNRHTFSKRESYDSNYGEAKRQAEAVFFQARVFPVLAVRFPIVLGPDDYTKRMVFHIEHILHHQPMYFPNLNARSSFVHSDDAARVLLRLSELDVTGPLNVCSPDSMMLADLMRMLEEILRVKPWIVSERSQGDASPFGLQRDNFMSAGRLKSLGIELPLLTDWIPDLVRASFIP